MMPGRTVAAPGKPLQDEAIEGVLNGESCHLVYWHPSSTPAPAVPDPPAAAAKK
jgi:hypothetical protein